MARISNTKWNALTIQRTQRKVQKEKESDYNSCGKYFEFTTAIKIAHTLSLFVSLCVYVVYVVQLEIHWYTTCNQLIKCYKKSKMLYRWILIGNHLNKNQKKSAYHDGLGKICYLSRQNSSNIIETSDDKGK